MNGIFGTSETDRRYLLDYGDSLNGDYHPYSADSDLGEYNFGPYSSAERMFGPGSARAQYLAARNQQQWQSRPRPGFAPGGSAGPATPRPTPSPTPTQERPASTQQVQQVAEGVKNVDLDNKVLGDLVSKALNFERKRITRNQQVFMASQFLDQVASSLTSGPKLINALSLAPIALMIPDRKKAEGVAGLLREPWAWVFASGLALLVLRNQEWRDKLRSILIGDNPVVASGSAATDSSVKTAEKGQADGSMPAAGSTHQATSASTGQSASAPALLQSSGPALQQAIEQMLQRVVTPAMQQAAEQTVQQAIERALQGIVPAEQAAGKKAPAKKDEKGTV